MTRDPEFVVQIAEDWRKAKGLDEIDRAILAFAEIITLRPWEISEKNIEALRSVGMDDSMIVDVIHACAYRNFITRIADATGCEPEEIWKKADPDMAETLDRLSRHPAADQRQTRKDG